MSLSFSLASTAADKVETDLLAVPVFGPDELGPGGAPVDQALGGGLAAFMEEAGFEGKPGQTLAVPTNGRAAELRKLAAEARPATPNPRQTSWPQ